jgi:hypothetical protein
VGGETLVLPTHEVIMRIEFMRTFDVSGNQITLVYADGKLIASKPGHITEEELIKFKSMLEDAVASNNIVQQNLKSRLN